jgi:hypothetical protein
MLSLTIHHNIHLSKAQRDALHAGEDVTVVGVSVPVWYVNKTTTEPAKEVFCHYYLRNPRKEVPIQIMSDGYEIALPYREGETLDISDEEWRKLNMEDPAKLDAMYKALVQEVSSKNLLDVRDGGCGSLRYREHNKIKYNGKLLNVMHFVNMDAMEHLTDSLSTA